MSFSNLKRNSASNLQKLQEEVQKSKKTGFESDPLDWYPSCDKAGNGLATIRYLPQINDDDLPFVKWWEHNFKDPNTNKYYINNCLSSIDTRKGQGIDPVLDFNKKLWDATPSNLSDEEKKKHPYRVQASRQGRKVNYRANIWIVSDGVNRDNSLQARKFKFGSWAFDAISGILTPSDLELASGVVQRDPFNMFDSPAYKIVIFSDEKKKVNGKPQRNYSKSQFLEASGPIGTDEEMEEIYNSIQDWSLKAYLAADKFKTYDELKSILDDVVGFDTAKWTPRSTNFEAPREEQAREIQSQQPKESPKQSEKVASDSEDFFKNLTEDSIDDSIPF